MSGPCQPNAHLASARVKLKQIQMNRTTRRWWLLRLRTRPVPQIRLVTEVPGQLRDNPFMPRKRRWLGAVLGGLILPFDPLLGMVLLLVGLWRPAGQAKRPASEA